MRRALTTLASIVVIGALVGCSTSSNPWSEKARAYADTLQVGDPGKVAEYIATACANPDLTGRELTDRFGAWDDLTGTAFSGFSAALRTVCPEQFPN